MPEAETATKPLPVVPFLKIPEGGEPYLEGYKCGSCGEIFLGQRMVCAACGTRNQMSAVKLSNKGKLYNLHRRAPELPGRAGAVHLGDRRSRRRRLPEGQPRRHGPLAARPSSSTCPSRSSSATPAARTRTATPISPTSSFRPEEPHAMTEVYVVGTDMIKFGRFPDRTVPNIGAEAALMALDDAGLTIKDMQALYCGNLGQAGGMVGQRVLREIGQTGIPVVNCANACATGATAFREGYMAIKAGSVRRGALRRRRADGQGPAGRRWRRRRHPDRGPAGLGHDAVGVRPRRHGAHPQVRHHLRAVRQGVGEEPPPLHPEPEGDVPDRNPAPGSDGRGDDLLSEHQADVLGERRRLGRRGDLLRRTTPRSWPDEAGRCGCAPRR